MPNKDWLDKLKIGDEVAINGLTEQPALDVVLSIRGGLIETRGHGRFKRATGYSTRSFVGAMWLVVPDGRIRAEITKVEVSNGI